jgi:hypothetical protein
MNRGVLIRSALVAAFGVASIAVPKLALPGVVFVLISFLALPSKPPALPRFARALHAAGALFVLVGLVRFLTGEAILGIVQGGTRAAGQRAVSRLRELLFAEDTARRLAYWDPDGDGIGSALTLAELLGKEGMRGERRLVPPRLEHYPELELTALGPSANIGGYYFAICLPRKDGTLAVEAKSPVDDELAERRFVAYAWPSRAERGMDEAYFLDEHERILSAKAELGRRLGPDAPPPCDDAVAEATREDWRPWRNKQPREKLGAD